MKPAGDYFDLYTWLKSEPIINPDTNAETPNFVDAGFLWGYERDLFANEMLVQVMLTSATTSKVYIRNMPPISTRDRLVNRRSGQEFGVDGITQDFENDQLILLVHRWGN